MKFEEEVGEDGSTNASDEEIEQFMQSAAARLSPSPDAGAAMWNLKEHILESSTPSDHAPCPMQHMLRTFSYLGLLGALLGLLVKHVLPQVLILSGGKVKTVEYDV